MGWVEYEINETGSCIWILMLFVRKRYRRRGIAGAIMRALFLKMEPIKGWIIPGTFTNKGEHMIPMFKRLETEFPAVELGSNFKYDYEAYCRRTPETVKALEEFRDSLYRR